MTPDADSPTPSAPSRNAVWLVELIPFGLGIFLGREVAYQQSVPGNELGGLGAIVLTFFISVILGVIGLVLLLMRRGRPAALLFAAVAAVVIGMVGTFKLGGALAATGNDPGITYRPPVVVRSIGTTQVSLSGVSNFSGVSDNGAACTSMDDSTLIGSVQTLNAGEFAGGTLRANLSLDTLGNAQISLWIDGADVPAGAVQPMWDGAASIRGATTGNAAGDADFTNATQADGDAGKGPAPTSGSWPGTLSGSLHWTCRT